MPACDHRAVSEADEQRGATANEPPRESPREPSHETQKAGRGIADQVFVVSSAMVGVCLTLMGLVRLIGSVSPVQTLADELLTIVAAIFLVSCLAAYLSVRTRSTTYRLRYERAADWAFISGMIAIVAAGAVVAFHIF